MKWIFLGVGVFWLFTTVNWNRVWEVNDFDKQYYYMRISAYPRKLTKIGYYVETYLEPVWWQKLRDEVFFKP